MAIHSVRDLLANCAGDAPEDETHCLIINYDNLLKRAYARVWYRQVEHGLAIAYEHANVSWNVAVPDLDSMRSCQANNV